MDICRNIKFKCFEAEEFDIKYIHFNEGFLIRFWLKDIIKVKKLRIAIKM